ncbi:ATP-binding protein [Planctomicrobium piriforme]|uniref:AAA+ ATPase domain-containing protein n=1 Tax=Planctomicrobium piriforme TaxID=1576369 RepID=A0A1I3P923_9PLAN|nr:AAA family ATPase [Planctomicrobium piriforme]SFJ17850.1 hypothetical protein SAMN05421753_11671 [Planctomicrobium piriforme]
MADPMTEIDELLRSLGFSAGDNAVHTTDKSSEQRPAGDHSSEQGTLLAERHSSSGMDPLAAFPQDITRQPIIKSKLETPREEIAKRTNGRFVPIASDSLEEAGLHFTELSDLLMKSLALRGIESGYNIARAVGMKFPVVEGVLRQLKTDRLVSYRNSATGGDYLYELTDQGRERARILSEQNSYLGTAPVPLTQYVESVQAQSIEGRKPPLASIRAAFGDLQVEDRLVSNLGRAIHSGRGMFLYGPAGNGKTSLAERITKSFGDTIWIPRAITAAGEIIRLFDPNRHKLAATSPVDQEVVDGRWVQIERPTIIAGGELRMENLEVTYIRRTGVGEAPLQMKANCGTLLIDDFGRQRMSIDELLNRWIVPLEERFDYLHLESGRSIQVPFDELIIFSTNLQPKDLVDEAFLRRIPYKIEVQNPTESEFRSLFRTVADQGGFECSVEMIEYTIDVHYRRAGRTFRFCHPRDLLRQIENSCSLHERAKIVTQAEIDEAVANYFAIMCDDHSA